MPNVPNVSVFISLHLHLEAFLDPTAFVAGNVLDSTSKISKISKLVAHRLSESILH